MEGPDSSSLSPGVAPGSVHVVTSPEAARALTLPERLRFFEPFLGRELTVKQAAAEAGCTLNAMFVRVRRFVGWGLLRVAREERRAGRAVKVYAPVAEVFFVPAEVSGEERRSWRAFQARAFDVGWRFAAQATGGVVGQRVYRNADGVPSMMSAVSPREDFGPPDGDGPAMFTGSHDALRLSFAQAKTLQRELHDLYTRYSRAEGEGRYILSVQFLPLPEDFAAE